MARLNRTHWADAAIVLIAAGAAVDVVLRDAPDAPRSEPALLAVAVLAITLPLLARRRYAFAAPAAVWLMATAVTFVDGRLVGFSPGLVVAGGAAAFFLGNLRDEWQARLGVAIILSSGAIIVYNDPDHQAGQFLFIPAQFAIFWIAGYALRERAVRAEAAEAEARLAVAEERARIARELHDVVAHAVSVMVLQVGAVRHRLPEGDDSAALQAVESAGRTALTEMRSLLGAMRRDGDLAELGPQPTLAELDALIGSVRQTGLDVDLRVEGEPAELPAALEMSAYRIIQEGLTNTIKHARATHADVRLRYAGDGLEIEVRDDGRGGASLHRGGHGLIGVTERVKIFGGEMTAGPHEDGFTLKAKLPLERLAA